MEVGLHEMEGLYERDQKNRIFEDLGLLERVTFLELPEFYRFINGRQDIVIPHLVDEAKSVLKAAFPGEEKGIDNYFWHMANVKRVMVMNRNKPEISIGEFLDGIIGDEDLKLVLMGNLGYYSDDPYRLGWLYYLAAQNSNYGGRSNYIQGGSQSLSSALMDIITENGGEVKLKHLVTGVEFKGGRAIGVRFRPTREEPSTIETAMASRIILGGALPNATEGLLPSSEGKSLSEAIAKQENGASLLTVYYGFKTALKDIGNRNYAYFIFDPSVKRLKDIGPNNRADFSLRSFTFVDYGQVDSRLAPEGKSVGAVCAIDYPSDWSSLARDEYLRMKADVADAITSRCEQFIPGFRDAADYVEVATSLSVQRFTLNPGGAVYGFAQLPNRKLDYLEKLPENVYVASAWGKLGGGFSGAFLNGYNTAGQILKEG
jgi:phytoene dehydrogenase-like protein